MQRSIASAHSRSPRAYPRRCRRSSSRAARFSSRCRARSSWSSRRVASAASSMSGRRRGRSSASTSSRRRRRSCADERATGALLPPDLGGRVRRLAEVLADERRVGDDLAEAGVEAALKHADVAVPLAFGDGLERRLGAVGVVGALARVADERRRRRRGRTPTPPPSPPRPRTRTRPRPRPPPPPPPRLRPRPPLSSSSPSPSLLSSSSLSPPAPPSPLRRPPSRAARSSAAPPPPPPPPPPLPPPPPPPPWHCVPRSAATFSAAFARFRAGDASSASAGTSGPDSRLVRASIRRFRSRSSASFRSFCLCSSNSS